MAKRLKYSRIDLVERTGALMLVTFLDDEGNLYQWAPKWSEAEQVFLKAINIERFNKPESAFLNKFAQTAQSVVQNAQRIMSAKKISGTFSHYEDQLMIVGGRALRPAFEITVDFLDGWIGIEVEALIVNDMVIRLRTPVDAGRFEEYPPKEVDPEDIPF